MRNHNFFPWSLIGALCLCGAAWASSLPPRVASDRYFPHQVNGIPTPNDDNDGVPDINDAVNLLLGSEPGDAGYYATNADLDALLVSNDALWSNLTDVVALVGLTASYSNTLGIYTDAGTGSATQEILGPNSGYGFTGEGTAERRPSPARSCLCRRPPSSGGISTPTARPATTLRPT